MPKKALDVIRYEMRGHMRKLTTVFTAVAATAALLVGCSGSTDPQTDTPAEGSNDTTASADAFPVTVSHESGETTIDAMPERIVVFDMAALDTLDTIGAGDQIVGVPHSSLPTWLESSYGDREDVGTLFEPDMEAVAKLNPDLVVVGARSAKLFEDFAKDYTTVDNSVPWTKADYAKRVAESVTMLGQATGHSDEGDAAATKINDAIDANQDTASDKGKAMVIMSNAGEISMHGPESRWSPIFEVFGFEPVETGKADEGHKGQKISFETVKELNPDYIFVVDRDAAVGNTEAGVTAEQVMDNELVAATTAAQNDNIVYLTPERWYIVMTGASNFIEELNEVADAVK